MRQYQPTTDEVNKLLKDYNRALELIVYAPNEDIAQNISNLIHGGRLLAYPDVFHNPSPKNVNDIHYDFILYENYRGMTTKSEIWVHMKKSSIYKK